MTRPEFMQRGYSLIEVLVAFAILSMALTVLMRYTAGGSRNVAVSSDYSHAVLIANSKLALPGVVEQLQPGISEGDVPPKFTWRRTISELEAQTETTNSDSPLVAYVVAVRVEWPSATGRRNVEFATIRLDNDVSTARPQR